MLASHRGPRFVPLWFAALLIAPGAELRTLAAPVALAIGVFISELVAKAPTMSRVIPVIAAVGSAAALGFAALTTFATSSDYEVVSPEDRAAAGWMRRSRQTGSSGVAVPDSASLRRRRYCSSRAMSTQRSRGWLPPITQPEPEYSGCDPLTD